MKIHSMGRAALLGAALVPMCAMASSHREAPAIAGSPRFDGTDFYMFRSYEPGRSGYVTFIANYIPLQDPEGGPNFFDLATEDNGVYNIHINNTGGERDSLNFAFRFRTKVKDLAVTSGDQSIPVPLINTGTVLANPPTGGEHVNVSQYFTIEVVTNGKGGVFAENATRGGSIFYKPLDNIGERSIPDYASYAKNFIQDVKIPNCPSSGRVYVGQRKEGFVANLGELFDLVNFNPLGARDGQPNALYDKNVTSIAIELPISCVTSKGSPIIGAYTTSSVVTSATDNNIVHQVSRVGMPLVNEVVIGYPDKDKFNGSSPKDDAQFLKYVTNPSLPVLLHALFGDKAVVPETPRDDLVTVYLTGVKGLNQPPNVVPGEMLRLNTSIEPTPPAKQNDLGVLGGDDAGFPNGRRPYDDVATITLRVAEGARCGSLGDCGSMKTDPNKGAHFTDGARSAGPTAQYLKVSGAIKATDTYLPDFPYLNTPIPGSPNSANGLTGLSE